MEYGGKWEEWAKQKTGLRIQLSSGREFFYPGYIAQLDQGSDLMLFIYGHPENPHRVWIARGQVTTVEVLPSGVRLPITNTE